MNPLAPTRRGEVVIQRSVWRAGPGLIGLRQRFTGDGVRVLVTHDASLLAVVEVLEGRVSFPLPGGEREAPVRFVLSVPPRSVLPIRYHQAVADSDGLGRRGAFVEGVPWLGAGTAFALDAMVQAPRLFALDADAGVPAAVARSRAALHAHLSDVAPVRAAARDVGLAPDSLTRAFAAAYGLSPKQYCTRARLFDAAIGLFCGAPVISAALSAGFNDVSRFYAQFKRLLHSTPARYARAGNRQDAPPAGR